VSTETIAIIPGIAGYPWFQNGGRHGSVREMYAVGKRWTKAVAIRTPVPKWRERKRKWWGTGRRGKRRTMMGKEHAGGCVSGG